MIVHGLYMNQVMSEDTGAVTRVGRGMEVAAGGGGSCGD